MSLDTLKAQAHRLHAYLGAHPEKAQALASCKQSACYDAIAAMHGARNWNTLCASVVPAPPAAPEPALTLTGKPRHEKVLALTFLPKDTPISAGLRAGEVAYLMGRPGAGKSYAMAAALMTALAAGHKATVLDIGRSYYLCTKVVDGTNACIEGFSPESDIARALQEAVSSATLATIEMDEFCRARLGTDLAPSWCELYQVLNQRVGLGHLVVVDEVYSLIRAMGVHSSLLVEFLINATKRGSLVVLIGQVAEDFSALRECLPPDLVVTLGVAPR